MEGYEDELSNVSLVSTISATSSVHQPQPPDGPKPSTQGYRARKSKVVRSPYLATSTPYHPAHHPRKSSASVTFHPGEGGTLGSKSAPTITRDKWVAAVKSSGFTPECWSSPSVHSSASSFLQSLMKTPSFSAVVTANMAKKKKKGSRNTAGDRSQSHPPPDPIALQDKIVQLKKEANAVSHERDLERAQRRKLELELGKKVKQIDELLSSGHITANDATRSLAGGRKTEGSDPTSGSNAVVSSLRQQLHTLEQALRGKERAYAALQRDVRASRVKELEVEGETYYQEVCRLRALLEQHSSVSPHSVQETQMKLKALSNAVVKLSSQLEQAESEKKHLEEDLKRLRCEHHHLDSFVHNEQGLRGSIADKYADHRRSEMLSAVVDLELKLQEKEKTLQSLCRELDQKRSQYDRRIGALTGNHSDATAKVKLLEGRLAEAESSREKLRNIVRKLKEDRAHYRSLAESTQVELEDIHDRLQREEVGRVGVVQELNVLREKHQSEMVAAEHAHKLAKRKSRVFTPDKKKQEAAATILQRQWRKRKAVKRQQKFQDSMEQATINIQRALRGHLARKSLLEPPSSLISSSPTPHENSSDSVAIETIQSALRGHLARHLALQDSASNVTEKGQYPATGLPASKDSVSKIAKLSMGVRAWNVEECSGDGGVGKRHSSGKINRSVLVDGKPPDLCSQVHHIGKREEKASENQAWRRNWEKEAHQSSPHTSNRAGDHIPSWGAGKGAESSGSEVGNADVESLDDEPSPVTPSHHWMLSSNDQSDQALFADELL